MREEEGGGVAISVTGPPVKLVDPVAKVFKVRRNLCVLEICG